MDGRLIDGVAVREWGDPAEPGILLWPGLGSTGAYFSAVGAFLPGRVVAVDPPGFGSSPPPRAYSYQQLVERSSVAIGECDCRAMLGHSLGADIALGVAAEPPVGLRAVVLVDGGYMDAATRAALGLPTAASRGELIAWLLENSPRFADWGAAVHGRTPSVRSARCESFDDPVEWVEGAFVCRDAGTRRSRLSGS
jgi:pimeloyl-ACP methyl ester carboxylesterase